MRILIVAATPIEVAPVVAGLRALSGAAPRLTRYAHAAHDVDVLITGVGMVGDGRLVLARAGALTLRPGAELRRVRQLRLRP